MIRTAPATLWGALTLVPLTLLLPMTGRAQAMLSITPLASFNGTNGAHPDGVTLDAQGNLYGSTFLGGTYNVGTVYQIPKGSTLSTLANIGTTYGSYPVGALAFDSSGSLYGTTLYTGTYNTGNGTIFKVTPGTLGYSVVATFPGSQVGYGGANPHAGVTFDSKGNLYGTTQMGGGSASSYGAVYQMLRGSNAPTTVASFTGSGANANGADPQSGVTLDSAGNIFGTARQGGANSAGTVYEIVAGSGVIMPLASFDTAVNGASPVGGVILDKAGSLFGTTSGGGPNGQGTVFEIVKGSGKITVLAQTVSGSLSGLVFDSAGNLFGTTHAGGVSGTSGYGTVFEIAAGTTTLTTIATFNGTNGNEPEGDLAIDGSGNLFGTTFYGGDNNDGVVFEIVGAAAPEPSQYAALGIGLLGLGGLAFKARRRHASD